jgi:hypothetical protein
MRPYCRTPLDLHLFLLRMTENGAELSNQLPSQFRDTTISPCFYRNEMKLLRFPSCYSES